MARSKIRVDPSQFLARYVLGFVLIVGFVVGAHGLHLLTIHRGALDQEVINVSGRQRMLSQRITFLSHRYMETGAPRYGDLLVQSIDLFESGHEWVVTNAIPPQSDIEATYMDVNGIDLDRRTRDFAALARGVFDAGPGTVEAAAISRQLEAIALTDLLVDLNGAVAQFEAAANDRVSRMERIQLVALAFTILILLVEVIYIFYPAHKTMAGMIDRLRFQAWHDALTGLLNRSRLVSRLTAITESSEPGLERTFVVALDLDGFKTVNDTLGHPVGDQVLQRVATIIETQLDAQNQLGECGAARAGGDEFIVFAQVSSGDVYDVAGAFCDAIISEVEAPISVSLGNGRYETCYVGTSAGVSFGAQSGKSLDTLLGDADIALYESKRRGKGVATAFQQQMRESAERKHHMTNELKAGLKSFEFEAHYQPQIALNDGSFWGVEALARWDHPERGLVGPAQFMDLAEESRLVDALDGQIMLDAFETYSEFARRGLPLGKLSLNASGLALRDPAFCDVLTRVASAHEVRADAITIEVLENVLIDTGDDTAVETIQRLLRAGFGVAVDDFGVGQSSLSRVANLDISSIKIDRSLTQRVGTRNMDKVLSATAFMAKGIGATLLAEGIETQAQANAMTALGVDVGQGYLWAKPLAKADLGDWIKAHNERHSVKLPEDRAGQAQPRLS